MRKRKTYPKTTWKRMKRERLQTLNPHHHQEQQQHVKKEEEEEEEEKGKDGKGFYACYLLTSLCPRFKGHTYIGFTVNPRRRIRQHNGEIRSGAFRTKKRRPWEMVLCLYGFPTNVSALQFEWAWQHPTESVNVRQAAATFKSFSGVANKIKLAYTMLSLPAWQSLNITVNYFSTKYMKHSASCPILPEHMKVQVCHMEELPCYTESGENLFEGRDAEDGWDDDEEYDKASDPIGTVTANMTELQACSMAEFLCHNVRRDSLSEVGDSENDGEEAKEYNEANNMSGCVKEKHADAIVNISADNAHGIDKTSYEQFGWFEEYGWRQQSNPPTPDVQPFSFVNSLVTTASSIVSTSPMRETRDGGVLTMFRESVSELDWPRGRKYGSKSAADKDQEPTHSFTVPNEIEVIDLLSPSPDCRVGLGSKKSKVSTVCPEIIDLT